MRADHLSDQGPDVAGRARHGHHLQAAGHVWPALGADLGAVLGARDGKAQRRRHLQLQMRGPTVKNPKQLFAAAATVALLVAVPTWAHHSFAAYDMDKTIVFTGVVTRVNPDANHLQIF